MNGHFFNQTVRLHEAGRELARMRTRKGKTRASTKRLRRRTIGFATLLDEARAERQIAGQSRSDEVAVLIDGARQIISLAANGHEGFINIPVVVLNRASSAKTLSVFRPEL
jgi:hypothetical protein